MTQRNGTCIVRWCSACLRCRYEFCASPSPPMVQPPPLGHGHLIIKASWSRSVRHTRLNRTPVDEWSTRGRDLYSTTHNTHKRQTSMPPAGIGPTVAATDHLGCSKWTAADPHFRLHGHWDRHFVHSN